MATWNLAAINNNPFEYWVTHSDPAYTQLMKDVQGFIDAPGAQDVAVGQVFTQDMFDSLAASMRAVGWEGVEEVQTMWENDFKGRQIISGYLKDKGLGAKRLASMPDRVTNTINLASGGEAYRPTVINCFEGDLGSADQWWAQWRTFIFDTSVRLVGSAEPKPVWQLFQTIKHSKYPALTEAEEKISLPLQVRVRACTPPTPSTQHTRVRN